MATERPGGATLHGNEFTLIGDELKVGDKARFVIPSDLAYGDAGAGGVIPPGATLIFDVELMDVK